MPKIKLHYPNATVTEATLRKRLSPKPGDIVMVFDPHSVTISNFTILSSIENDPETAERFIAPMFADTDTLFRWTYAYKVPEGYASVEASND